MKQQSLPIGLLLLKMKRVVAFLLLTTLWVGAAKSQTKVIGFDFTGSAQDYSVSDNQTSVRTSDLSGATLTSLTASTHTTGLAAVSAVNSYLSYTATGFNNGGTYPNVTKTENYIQFSVTAPAGQVFDNHSLSLAIAAFNSSLQPGDVKGYQIYYKYSTDASGIPTDTVSTTYGDYVSGIGSIVSTNTATIPAPGNVSSTVLTIQVRIWGASNAGSLNINSINLTTTTPPLSPVPTITGFNPASSTIYAGDPLTTTIAIAGSYFANVGAYATSVTYDGKAKTFNLSSDASIIIPVTTADLTLGTHTIVVTNTGIGTTATSSFVVVADPAVTIANGTQPSAANIGQASTKNILQSFAVTIANNPAVLTSIKAHFTGTYTASDISNFRVYTNTTNNFATATAISAYTGNNSNTTNGSPATTGSEFLLLNDTTGTAYAVGTQYFWITADIAANANIATPASTIQATALSSSDFTFQTTTINSCSVSVGGVQTLVQGVNLYMSDIANNPAGNIVQNTTTNSLAGFSINPPAGKTDATITSINVFADGTATTADLKNLAIYRDVNGTGVYASNDVKVSTNSPAFLASTSTPMVFTLNETITTKTNYIIVADVADVLVSTVGHNVSFSVNGGGYTANYPAAGGFGAAANNLIIASPAGATTVTTTLSAAAISSIANTQATAVAAWKFTVKDDGVIPNVDNAPTLLSTIKVKAGSGTSIVDLSAVFAGATLTDGVTTQVGTIGLDNITFKNIPTGTTSALGYVADNASKTYTLNVWVKSAISSLYQPIAGKRVNFSLDSTSFYTKDTAAADGFSTSNFKLGSQFASIAHDSSFNTSGNTADTIQVTATKLIYTQQPSSVGQSTVISPAVTVQGVDANGNYSKSFNSNVVITSTPTGVAGTLTQASVAGQATFSDLQFANINTYTLTATSGSLSVTSSSVSVKGTVYYPVTGFSYNTNYGTQAWAVSSPFNFETANWFTSNANALSNTGAISFVEGSNITLTGVAVPNAKFGGRAITVTKSHSTPILEFATPNGVGLTYKTQNKTGDTLTPIIYDAGISGTPTDTLTLTGSSPVIKVNTAGTINLPIVAQGRVTISATGADTYGFCGLNLGNNNPITSSANGTPIKANNYSFSSLTHKTGVTISTGVNMLYIYCKYPFGTYATDTLFVNSTAAQPLSISTNGATSVTTAMPLVVANTISLADGAELCLGPTGASTYGNLTKYMGPIIGNASVLVMSNYSAGSGTAYPVPTFDATKTLYTNAGGLVVNKTTKPDISHYFIGKGGIAYAAGAHSVVDTASLYSDSVNGYYNAPNFGNTGKGMMYFGARNTYSGTTYMAGNQSSLILGTRGALPASTDLMFYSNVTGGVTGDRPFVDLGVSGTDTIASLITTDGQDSATVSGNPLNFTYKTTLRQDSIHQGGIYNSSFYTQIIDANRDTIQGSSANAITTSGGKTTFGKYGNSWLIVFDSLVNGKIAVGQKVFGSGITYGTTISYISPATKKSPATGAALNNLLYPAYVDTIYLSQSQEQTQSVKVGSTTHYENIFNQNFGFYVFFENSKYDTLVIGGSSVQGTNFGPRPTSKIDRTNAIFSGTISGNVALILGSTNNKKNKLTLLNQSNYSGSTIVTSGTLVLNYTTDHRYNPTTTRGNNTIPATDSIIINGADGTVQISSPQTLSNLNISAGNLIVDANTTLTITGVITLTGGTITNNGTIVYNGTSFVNKGTNINNNGTFTIANGAATFAAGIFNNNAGKTLNVGNNIINVTGGTFNNYAALATNTVLQDSAGTFDQEFNQTFDSLNVRGTGIAYIGQTNGNTTVTITKGLTVGGTSFQNSGNPIVYNQTSGRLILAKIGRLVLSDLNAFGTGVTLPVDLTVNQYDTLLLDKTYSYAGPIVNNGCITSQSTSFVNATGVGCLNLTGVAQSISGKGSYGFLNINAPGGVITTGADTVNILNRLQVSNGSLNIGGYLALKSSSIDSSATVDQFNLAQTPNPITGNTSHVVVERAITNKYRGYRDLTPGVEGAGSIWSNWQESGKRIAGYGTLVTGQVGTDNSFPSTPNNDPTSGIDVSLTGVFSAEVFRNGGWIFFNNNATAYGATHNTTTDPLAQLTSHYGYRLLVRGDRSKNIFTQYQADTTWSKTVLRATGTLNIGDYFDDGTTLNSSLVNGAFSSVGNPYVAPISWSQIVSDNTAFTLPNQVNAGATANTNSAPIQPTYYGLVRFGPNVVYGHYNALNPLSSLYLTDTIQAGQSFYILHNNSSTPFSGVKGGTSVWFNENDKFGNSVHKIDVFGVKPVVSLLTLKLVKQPTVSYNLVDQANLTISASFTQAPLVNYTSTKVTNPAENLAIYDSVFGNTALASDARKVLSSNDKLNLSVTKLTAGVNYRMVVDASSYIANGLIPYVLDKYNNKTYNMIGDSIVVDFTTNTDAASFGTRFVLLFNASVTPVKSINVTATKVSGGVKVDWTTIGQVNVASYQVESSSNGIDFVTVASVAANNSNATYSAVDTKGATYYRIKAIDVNGAVSYSIIVVVNEVNLTAKVNVYPNPVTNNRVHITLSSAVVAGNYSIKVVNMLGQTIYTGIITHNGDNALHEVLLPSATAAGEYNLSIVSVKDNAVIYSSSVQVK